MDDLSVAEERAPMPAPAARGMVMNKKMAMPRAEMAMDKAEPMEKKKRLRSLTHHRVKAKQVEMVKLQVLKLERILMRQHSSILI
ncbi:MAG: hypothetical protein IPO06_15960 [Leptospiraceae bacterium]|nr:hypothetical protein [Leptospiraceae bacterium]